MNQKKCSVDEISVLSLVFFYLIVGCSITIYDKWVIKDYRFHFPVTILLASYSFNFLLLGSLRLSKRLCFQTQIKVFQLNEIVRIVPLGILSGVETACSVSSLLTLSVSFHTMIKATVPVFVLFFSLILKLQSFRWSVLTSVLIILVGVVILSWGEEVEGGFALSGFLYALFAAVIAGLKWALTQVYLQTDQDLDPMSLLFYLSPICVLSLVPAFFIFEARGLYHAYGALGMSSHLQNAAVLVAVGFIAFLVLTTEFSVVKRTSSLTYSVLTMVKEMTLYLFGVWFLSETIGPRSLLGFFVCMTGISWYAYLKQQIVLKTERLAQARLEMYSVLQDLDEDTLSYISDSDNVQ